MMYEERNQCISINIFLFWLLTILNCYKIQESYIINTLLIGMSSILTIICIVSMITKKKCNISVAVCSQYCALHCVLSGYIYLFDEFDASLWIYFAMNIIYFIFELAVLKIYIIRGKPYMVKSSFSTWTAIVALAAARGITKILEETNSEVVTAISMCVCFMVLAFSFGLGIRYFVLDDSRMLYIS